MPTSQNGQMVELARGLYLEGLTYDSRRNMVWYSDVIAGGIHGVKADGSGTAATLNPERMWTGGVMMNGDGAVLSTGEGGIKWNHPDTGKSGWLISEINGQSINGVNEMVPDGTGGIFFDTLDLEHIVAGKPTRPSAIYRLSMERKVFLLAEDMGLANGMMLSADGKHLYCNSTFVSPYVFDVDGDLSLSNRRRLIHKEDCDGMALDEQGNVWITGFRSSAITRVRPDGTLLDPVPTPGDAVTQIRFGGPDRRDFYITCVPGDGGDDLAVGKKPTEHRSFLYRGRSDIPGRPMAPATFKLS
jgi:sugar lactone lactonase YvrE